MDAKAKLHEPGFYRFYPPRTGGVLDPFLILKLRNYTISCPRRVDRRPWRRRRRRGSLGRLRKHVPWVNQTLTGYRFRDVGLLNSQTMGCDIQLNGPCQMV